MADIEKAKAPETPGWFERWFEGFPRLAPLFGPDLFRLAPEGPDLLRVEEVQQDDAVVVRAEIPGIDPDRDVEITVSDGRISIRAERRQESKVEEPGRVRSEFRYGSFSRSLPLPAGATEHDVTATYKDGILEVRVPVSKSAAEAKRINVQRG